MTLASSNSGAPFPALTGLFLIFFLFCASGVTRGSEGKVTPKLRQETLDGRTARFLVLMAEQAELPGADLQKLERKARGRQVVSALRQAAERSQDEIHKEVKARGGRSKAYWIVNAVAVEGKAPLLDRLAERADVLAIESDCSIRAPLEKPQSPVLSVRADPGVEPNIAHIGAPGVWATGFTGQGIVYANSDTGVAWTHPALRESYRGWDGTKANHNYNWWDAIHSDISGDGTNAFGFSSPIPVDDDGHGTHTMGIAVGDDGLANHIGVAPGSRWIACRNMEDGVGRPSTYLECLQFFLAPTDLAGNNPDPDRRPDCVGNSWTCPPEELCAPATLHLALQNLRAAGVFVVASAGNEGSNCSTVNDPPALDAAVFTVGASTLSDSMAWFSSRGPVTIDGSQRMKPELVAPGESVRSSYEGAYVELTGTSMSAPHVSGAVALLWSALPGIRGDITYTADLMQKTAAPVTSTQLCGSDIAGVLPNNVYGYGRLDVLAAYQNATSDTDHDGLSNVEEYLAGTDPRNSNSVLRLMSIRWDTNTTSINLAWSSIGGKRYRVQYANLSTATITFAELVRAPELETDSAPAGTASTMFFTDDFSVTGVPPPGSTRLYRVVLAR